MAEPELIEEAVDDQPMTDDVLLAELGDTYDEVTAEVEEEPEAPTEASDDRARGPDGKFVSVGEEAPEMAAPAEEIQPDAPIGEQAVVEEPVEQVISPAPTSWSEEAKAQWSALDPKLQAELSQQETARAAADEQKDHWFKEMTPIAQALQPVAQQLQLSGVQPAAYVQQLVAADQYLRSDPQAALKMIAQQYGATLPEADSFDGEFGEQPDPQLAPVVDTVTKIQQQINGLIEAQQESQTQQLTSEIAEFSKDKPHFDAVSHQMGDLIRSGVASDLKSAYDMAVWSNPEIRATMLKASPTAEVVPIQPKEDPAKRAAAARRHAATNLRTAGTAGGTPVPHESEESELGAVFDSMQGQ